MLNRNTGKMMRLPALILLYLVLAAAVLALFHSYTQNNAQELSLTPKLDDNRGWDIYCIDEKGVRVPMTSDQTSGRAGTIYLSRVLDAGYEEEGYTTLETDGPVSVFLDGALLYTTAPGSGSSPEEALPEGYKVPSAGETPRLTLPPGYGGKTLTLVFNRGADVFGTPMVILSSRAVETAQIAAAVNSKGMPAATYMTAAFLLLGLLFYGGFQDRWDWPMLLLTLAAIFQALYQLRDFSLSLIFHAPLDIRAAALIPPLFVALPMGYLLCQMGHRRRKLRTVLVLLPAAVSLVPQFLYLLNLSLPEGWEMLCNRTIYISIAVTLVCAVEEARAGNRTFRLFLAGLGTLVGALAIACLFSSVLTEYVGWLLLEAVQGNYYQTIYWCGAVLFVLCAVLSVGNAIQTTAEGRVRTELLTAQVSALEGRVTAIQAAEEAIRIERHDLRHRLQIAAGMVERNEKAQALDFLGAAQTRLEELKTTRWCQNPVLDAVFASYFGQAKRQHIKVETSLAIPDELPVNKAELSTVFANALENAIHACALLPEGERRIICKCLSRPGLMFEVANTCTGQVRFDADGLPASSRRGHGIGVRSIAAFCEKHGAICTYEVKDGWFRMRIVL